MHTYLMKVIYHSGATTYTLWKHPNPFCFIFIASILVGKMAFSSMGAVAEVYTCFALYTLPMTEYRVCVCVLVCHPYAIRN